MDAVHSVGRLFMTYNRYAQWGLRLVGALTGLCISHVSYALIVPTYTRIVVDLSSPNNPWMKSIGDLNGDGRPDLVVAGSNGPIVSYKSPNWKKDTISISGQGDSGSAIGDIDADGDSDVIVGRTWYENLGTGTLWTPHLIDDAVGTHDISIADMNADGKADVIMRGEETNPVTIFLQVNPTTWTKFSINPGIGLNGLDIADINGDGRLDVVVSGVWMENPGGSISTTTWPKHTFATWNSFACVKVVDMDGDGLRDVVLSVSEATGKLSWFKAPVDPTTGPWAENIIASGLVEVHAFVVSDLDHDGLLDVTASEYGGSGRLISYLNIGGATVWQANVLGTDALHNVRGSDLNNDGTTDFFGVYAIGVNPVILYLSQPDSPLPIQLANFTATPINQSQVRLNWTTLTEINNYGFEVQRSDSSQLHYLTIPNSFIPGHGTTNEPQYYTYINQSVPGGVWYYRLKQSDLDGTIHYTDGVRVDMLTGVKEKETPTVFSLSQNYPNPFNPSTTIRYGLPRRSFVTVTVYTMLGQQVAQLVNEEQGVGYHEVMFENPGLASGVYVYKLQADGYMAVRKLLLMK